MRSPLLRVVVFLVGYMLILLAASVPKGMAPPRLADFVWGATASVAILGLTQLFLRREGRTRHDIGLDVNAGTVSRLLVGAAIGAAVYALTLAMISLLLGPIQFSPLAPPAASTWVVTMASFLVLSCMEELGFRGYALRSLVPAIGVWQAQVGIALAFGLSHIAFGWPWTTVAVGVIPSALLFGVTAVRSGGLAMPIGLHAAVNLAQWSVGEKDTPGVWTLAVDPSLTERMGSGAPFIGMTVTLLAAALVWALSTARDR